jgi:rubrerythrin
VHKIRALDLWSLSLRDALDLAILVEEEAKDRYGEFAQQMALHHNEPAARFFRFMIDVEAAHEHVLLDRRRRLFGLQPATVQREMLFDVEAPDYDEVRATMSERSALEAALRAEEKAYAFFDAAARLATDPEVAALFFALREEEADHQTRIKGRMADLPPEPLMTAEDVDDGPVAH